MRPYKSARHSHWSAVPAASATILSLLVCALILGACGSGGASNAGGSSGTSSASGGGTTSGGQGTSTTTNNCAPSAAPTSNGTSSGGVLITAPVDGCSVTSPVQVSAQASQGAVDHLILSVDGTSLFWLDQPSLVNSYIFMPPSEHAVAVQAFDAEKNVLGQDTIQLDVTAQTAPTAISQIQNLPSWEWCSADRDGHACASGLGNATSSMAPMQAVPSLSGASATFTIGGPKGYSNALWWKSLGGGMTVAHFTYEMDFNVSDPDAPEALEFDVNQSFGGVRYTWGSECSFQNTKKWDIWNPAAEVWVSTKVPCPILGQGWHHLVWNLERVNNQVHYISLTLDANTYTIDTYFDLQPGWNLEDIDVAFQMDGNYRQAPYSVSLDNVTLTAW